MSVLGCADKPTTDDPGDSDPTSEESVDADRDGFTAEEDCDDTDPEVHDADLDSDGDGVSACDGDCDDAHASTYPGAPEICNEIDEDCDGSVDEEAVNPEVFYVDADADGYGDPELNVLACLIPDGHAEEGTDCNDTDPALNQDDSDGDGFSTCDGDCDDRDPRLNPDSAEDCSDGLDRADAKFIGESEYDYAGSSISSAGDVDGDGFDDLLIGAPGESSAEASGGAGLGAAYLVLGGTAADTLIGTIDLSDADAKFVGETSESGAGGSVSGVGDVDGDGFDDLLIGAYGEDSRGRNTGAAYLVLGGEVLASGAAPLDLAAADAKFAGEAEYAYAGFSVSGAGDVNSDGLADLLIGSYGESSGGHYAGAIYLVLGGATVTGEMDLSMADAKLIGESEGSQVGVALSGADDVNGDGFDDLILGSFSDDSVGTSSGAAYVVLGPISGTESLSTADAKLIGENDIDRAGYSVSSAGDVDGDGLGDLLIGAYDGDDDRGSKTGAAYLVLGGTLTPDFGEQSLSSADAKFIGENSDDYAGIAVSGVGDVNDDGFDDLLIGAYGESNFAGAAYLLLGPVTGTRGLAVSDAKLTGEHSDDIAGLAVSGAGDVDGDGLDDLLVGAFRETSGGSEAGAAYLLYGKRF